MGSALVRTAADLPALRDIEQIDGNLYIEGDDTITSLDDLGCLRVLRGELLIRNNPRLQSLAGLARLEHLESTQAAAGTLSIVENAALSDLTLPALTSVAHRIHICGNPSLSELRPISKLTHARQISIIYNPALSNQAAQNFAAGVSVNAPTKIGANGGQGTPLPQPDCPWSNDGVCDEPRTRGGQTCNAEFCCQWAPATTTALCAAGTEQGTDCDEAPPPL
jgi:hypothetical protein